MNAWRGPAACVLSLVALGACELAEVAAPESADVLVVEAVLRVGAERQHVLLHRSLEGAVVRGEPDATVSVAGPGGERVDYQEVELGECLDGSPMQWRVGGAVIDATCYVSPETAGYFVQPGQTYDLLVSTQRGEIARGRTAVPLASDFIVPSVDVHPVTRTALCRLPNDPFTLVWSRAEGAWSYIIGLELRGWGWELRAHGIEFPEPLELTGVSVSANDTTLHFPGNVGVFQRGDFDQRVLLHLADGLDNATEATLVVLAADRNFTNSIRGGRFNPSGNVRGSSVVGDAVGVFGAVSPITIRSPLRRPGGGAPPPCPVPD